MRVIVSMSIFDHDDGKLWMVKEVISEVILEFKRRFTSVIVVTLLMVIGEHVSYWDDSKQGLRHMLMQ